MDGAQQLEHGGVTNAALDAQGALPDRVHVLEPLQPLADAPRPAEPEEACGRQDDSVERRLGVIQLAQPCVQVATLFSITTLYCCACKR